MHNFKLHTRMHPWLSLALMATLPYSLKLSSIMLILLILNSLLYGQFRNRWKEMRIYQPWLLAAALVFILPALRGLFEENPALAIKNIEKKTAFLLLPFFFLSMPRADERANKIFVYGYSAGTFFLTLYVLIDAILRAIDSQDAGSFFYHSLGEPFGLHAVYFSLLLIANMLLTETCGNFPMRTGFHLWILSFLFLLSSKLMVLSGILIFFFLLTRRHRQFWRKSKRAFISLSIVGFALIAFTNNPLKSRFMDISAERLKYVSAEYVGEDVYLDGLSLRLLQIRFALEIAGESGQWMYGVGPGSSQKMLDEKYRQVHLYAPDNTDDRGYIGYNFHNQYAETLVQTGVLGLISLLFCLGLPLVQAIRNRQQTAIALAILFILFCITESVFERQMGVFSFLLLSSWMMKNRIETLSNKEIKPDLV